MRYFDARMWPASVMDRIPICCTRHVRIADSGLVANGAKVSVEGGIVPTNAIQDDPKRRTGATNGVVLVFATAKRLTLANAWVAPTAPIPRMHCGSVDHGSAVDRLCGRMRRSRSGGQLLSRWS